MRRTYIVGRSHMQEEELYRNHRNDNQRLQSKITRKKFCRRDKHRKLTDEAPSGNMNKTRTYYSGMHAKGYITKYNKLWYNHVCRDINYF